MKKIIMTKEELDELFERYDQVHDELIELKAMDTAHLINLREEFDENIDIFADREDVCKALKIWDKKNDEKIMDTYSTYEIYYQCIEKNVFVKEMKEFLLNYISEIEDEISEIKEEEIKEQTELDNLKAEISEKTRLNFEDIEIVESNEEEVYYKYYNEEDDKLSHNTLYRVDNVLSRIKNCKSQNSELKLYTEDTNPSNMYYTFLYRYNNYTLLKVEITEHFKKDSDNTTDFNNFYWVAKDCTFKVVFENNWMGGEVIKTVYNAWCKDRKRFDDIQTAVIFMLSQKDGVSEEVFSEQLKQIRKGKGITQKQACEMLNVPKRTYENWEYGIRTPAQYVQYSVIETLKSI